MKGWTILLLVSVWGNLIGSEIQTEKLSCDWKPRQKFANELSAPHFLILRDVRLTYTFPRKKEALAINRTTNCKAMLTIMTQLSQWNTNNVLNVVLRYYQSDILALPSSQREVFWREISTRSYSMAQSFVDLLDRKNAVARSKAFITGKTLIASAREGRPSNFVTFNEEGTQVISLRGDCFDMIDIIKENVRFNYSFVPTFEAATFTNGTWRGIIGKLLKKEIDISLQPLAIDYERHLMLDFSFRFSNFPATLLIPYPRETRSLLASTWPFSPTVWLCLIVAIIVVTITLSVASVLPLMQGLPQSFLFTYGVLTCQGVDCPKQTFKVRSIAGAWGLATLIFVYTYNSQLTSFLTVPQLYPLVDSIDDLANNNKLELTIMAGNGFLYEFLNATTGPYKLLGDRIRSSLNKHLSATFDEGIDKVVSGKYAFVVNAYAATYYGNLLYKKTRTCSVMLVKKHMYYGGGAFMLQKNSPYSPIINAKLQQIIEGGLVDYMIKHSSSGLPRFQDHCKVPVKDVPTTIVLSLSQLESAFTLLGLGLILASITFLFELLIKFRKGRKYFN